MAAKRKAVNCSPYPLGIGQNIVVLNYNKGNLEKNSNCKNWNRLSRKTMKSPLMEVF